MGFQEAVTSVLSKYATFTGRARRSEYWYFFLFNFLLSAVIRVVFRPLLGATITDAFNALFTLALFAPSLAVSVRRLHDMGRSGWNLLFFLIPFVGWVIVLVFLTQDSQPGVNAYGPNPKEETLYP